MKTSQHAVSASVHYPCLCSSRDGPTRIAQFKIITCFLRGVQGSLKTCRVTHQEKDGARNPCFRQPRTRIFNPKHFANTVSIVEEFIISGFGDGYDLTGSGGEDEHVYQGWLTTNLQLAILSGRR